MRRGAGPASRFGAAAALLLGSSFALGAPSCVRVRQTYLDAGDRTSDSPTRDAAVGADATRAVLRSIGERVIMPALTSFEAAATVLVEATEAYASSLGGTERDAARAAWRAAMAIWQRLEVLQVGPAGLASVTVGGLGLRDEIDAWPLVSRCRIDQETVETAHADPAAFAAETVNVRGLGAMEYLLFYEPTDNGCPSTASINTTGAWAALGDAEIVRRRAVYAHTLAVLVRERAVELRAAWDPTGGNYLGAFATAGAGSGTFASAQAGLNALSDALFYLYKEVLDLKLGIPAGLRLECPTETCPSRVESPWAGASLDHVRVNLEAFRDAYLGAPAGTDGSGFDDLLRSIGATDLDARIAAAFVAVFAALDAVDGRLEVALAGDLSDVVALHDATRALADLFKVEVLTIIDLELPMRIEGDND